MATECAVCMEVFTADGDRVPKLLPCSHTLCLGCVRLVVRGGRAVCPECRRQNPLPQGGVQALPTNRYVLDYVELSHRSRRMEEQLASVTATAPPAPATGVTATAPPAPATGVTAPPAPATGITATAPPAPATSRATGGQSAEELSTELEALRQVLEALQYEDVAPPTNATPRNDAGAATSNAQGVTPSTTAGVTPGLNVINVPTGFSVTIEPGQSPVGTARTTSGVTSSTSSGVTVGVTPEAVTAAGVTPEGGAPGHGFRPHLKIQEATTSLHIRESVGTVKIQASVGTLQIDGCVDRVTIQASVTTLSVGGHVCHVTNQSSVSLLRAHGGIGRLKNQGSIGTVQGCVGHLNNQGAIGRQIP